MTRTSSKPANTVNLSDRAIDNLEYIRGTIERSVHFTAVPGYGGVLMGVTAVAAAYIAHTQINIRNSLITWLIEAFVAFGVGLLAMWRKSKIAGQSLLSSPARKFALGFLPPMIAGVAITLAMWRHEYYYVIPAICMVCYGAAVVCGGAFSVRVVPVMGWCFIVLGSLAFWLPASYSNVSMAASFGALHIIFGAVIAKKYGG